MQLEEKPEEAVPSLFRIFHSLKASSGMLHLDHFTDFAHALESFLSKIRDGELSVSPEMVDFLFYIQDILQEIKKKLQLGYEEKDFRQDTQWLEKLEKGMVFLSGYELERRATGQESREKNVFTKRYRVCFRPHQDFFSTGSDPLIFIEEMHRQFSVLKTRLKLESLPEITELDPYMAYLEWDMEVSGAKSEKQLEDIFEFIDDEKNLLRIQPLKRQQNKDFFRKSVFQKSEVQIQDFVRVHTRKLDEMVNLFGELVIGFSRIRESILTQLHGGDSLEMVEDFSRILKDFQDRIMTIRMVSLGPLFHQFYRFIREGAAVFEKKVRLEISGEETELDKAIADKIGEPLKHLIRNSLDHGIETPEERIKAGKDPVGTISLSAEHREGNIYITVSDDGRGLDPERIREKALEKGLISPERAESLEESQIYELIFLPGFSTLEDVSEYSGRGVGMDVVKMNIEEIRGSIQVQTRKGEEATFILKLPLTLSILEGIIFRVGEDHLAIPVYYIREMLKMKEPETLCYQGKVPMLNLRGKYYPLFWLDQFFTHLNYRERDIQKGYLLFLEVEEKPFFLPVEEIIGEQQIVLKQIPQLKNLQQGIMGSSVLGNGEILFILDMFSVFEKIRQMTDFLPALGGKEEENEEKSSLEHS
jgi:two-component system chemotaxis sensor kinase CheA